MSAQTAQAYLFWGSEKGSHRYYFRSPGPAFYLDRTRVINKHKLKLSSIVYYNYKNLIYRPSEYRSLLTQKQSNHLMTIEPLFIFSRLDGIEENGTTANLVSSQHYGIRLGYQYRISKSLQFYVKGQYQKITWKSFDSRQLTTSTTALWSTRTGYIWKIGDSFDLSIGAALEKELYYTAPDVNSIQINTISLPRTELSANWMIFEISRWRFHGSATAALIFGKKDENMTFNNGRNYGVSFFTQRNFQGMWIDHFALSAAYSERSIQSSLIQLLTRKEIEFTARFGFAL